MFPYKKNWALEQYKKTILKHVLTSNFVYSSLEGIPRVCRLRLNIETKKNKKVYALYLFLLTGQIPYIKKSYPSWKNANTHGISKPKAATNRAQVAVRPKNKFVILSEVINNIISKQLTNEKRIWRFQEANMQVRIPTISLIKSTACLQGKNGYFPNFPLILHFKWSKITAFQKVFFLRSLKIIALPPKIKSLDSLA